MIRRNKSATSRRCMSILLSRINRQIDVNHVEHAQFCSYVHGMLSALDGSYGRGRGCVSGSDGGGYWSSGKGLCRARNRPGVVNGSIPIKIR